MPWKVTNDLLLAKVIICFLALFSSVIPCICLESCPHPYLPLSPQQLFLPLGMKPPDCKAWWDLAPGYCSDLISYHFSVGQTYFPAKPNVRHSKHSTTSGPLCLSCNLDSFPERVLRITPSLHLVLSSDVTSPEPSWLALFFLPHFFFFSSWSFLQPDFYIVRG